MSPRGWWRRRKADAANGWEPTAADAPPWPEEVLDMGRLKVEAETVRRWHRRRVRPERRRQALKAPDWPLLDFDERAAAMRAAASGAVDCRGWADSSDPTRPVQIVEFDRPVLNRPSPRP